MSTLPSGMPDGPAAPRVADAAASPGRVLFHSAATAAIFRVVNVASGIVTLPILLSALARTDFGVWVVISQSVSLLALSDLGAGNAIGRFVARSRGLGDRAEQSEVLSTVLAILLGAAVVVVALTLALAGSVPGWVGVDGSQRSAAQVVFIIVGLGIAAQLPLRIALGVLIGHQLYGPHAIGKIAESLLGLIGIVALALLGKITLVTLALITAASAVAAQVLLLAVAWRLTGPWDIAPARVTGAMASRIFGMGGSVLMMTAAAMVSTQGTGLMAGRLAGLAEAAIYGVALTVVGNLNPLITSLAIPLSTLSSEWQARNDMEKLRRTSHAVMRLSFAAAACIAVGLVIFGEAALRLWLQASDWTDADFMQAGRALAIMGVAVAIGIPQIGSRSTLLGVGHHWLVGGSVFAASVVSLACGVAAMAAGWGVSGAAIGWSVVWIIQGTVLFPPIIARYLQEPVVTMMWDAYWPGAILAGVVAAAAVAMVRATAPRTPVEFALAATPAVVLACGGLLYLAPGGFNRRLGLGRA